MKLFLLITVFATSLTAACSSTQQSSANSATVETKKPNSPDFTPAFAGQTRTARVATATAWKPTIITSALEKPWSMAALPDGRFLITQKTGSLRIVSTSGTVSNTI